MFRFYTLWKCQKPKGQKTGRSFFDVFREYWSWKWNIELKWVGHQFIFWGFIAFHKLQEALKHGAAKKFVEFSFDIDMYSKVI